MLVLHLVFLPLLPLPLACRRRWQPALLTRFPFRLQGDERGVLETVLATDVERDELIADEKELLAILNKASAAQEGEGGTEHRAGGQPGGYLSRMVEGPEGGWTLPPAVTLTVSPVLLVLLVLLLLLLLYC